MLLAYVKVIAVMHVIILVLSVVTRLWSKKTYYSKQRDFIISGLADHQGISIHEARRRCDAWHNRSFLQAIKEEGIIHVIYVYPIGFLKGVVFGKAAL